MDLLLQNESTQRLTFRLIEALDLPKCMPFFEDPRTHRHWKSMVTEPAALAREWLERQLWRYREKMGGMNLLVHKETEEIVGWAGLLVQEVDGAEEVEIGYSIMPQFWNQGYATEAARHCREVARQRGWMKPLISIIQVDNIASQKVAMKNGMTPAKRTLYKGNQVIIFQDQVSM